MLAHMNMSAPTPELYKSPPPPAVADANGPIHYESSPGSSDGSGGTVHHYSPPPDTAHVVQPELQHRSELEYALDMSSSPMPVKVRAIVMNNSTSSRQKQEIPRQRFTPPTSFAVRKVSPPARSFTSSSSLENALGDSFMGSSSSSGSAASSNSSLPLLTTPIDPQPQQQQFVMAPDHAPFQQQFVQDPNAACYAAPHGYYPAPALQVQPPSAGVGLGIDHSYPFFGP